MKISARIDYACRALLELALHWPNHDPLSIETIALRQQIPTKFLTQILVDLKRIGCVASVRGKNGGYRLAKAPDTIRLNAVIEGFSGNETQQRGEKENSFFAPIWKEIDRAHQETMAKFSLEDICNRKRGADNSLTFQI